MPVPILVLIAEATGAVIGYIGKKLLKKKITQEIQKKAAEEVAKKAATETTKQVVKEKAKEELKDLAREFGEEVMREAIEAVGGTLKEAGEDMRREAGRKSTELILIATGSPNPTRLRNNEEITYKPYFVRRIPFRPVLCKLLCFANKYPILKKARIPAKAGSGEEIKVRVTELRQLAAAIMIDALDKGIEGYKSFLKSEVSYDRSGKAYMETETKPKRIGSTYWIKPRGSINPDVVIPENRHARPDRDNLFAIVEVKFPNDRIKDPQIDRYDRIFDKHRVSIVRVPEDCPNCGALDKDKKKKDGEKDKSGKSSSGKRGR